MAQLFYRKSKTDKKGKWSDVFRSLFFILTFYLILRWVTFEPYVIPSGSMIPTFLVQDYVLVKKWAYGLRVPFSEDWLIGPTVPKRGDIVVFKSVDDSQHFLVKRVVGLPGDEVTVLEDGRIEINGIEWAYDSQPSIDNETLSFLENNQEKSYIIQFDKDLIRSQFITTVPEGEIFLMGDNRDHSMDSRYWGTLPINRVLGKVSLIWFSCGDSESHSSLLCSPEAIRWDRIKLVQ